MVEPIPVDLHLNPNSESCLCIQNETFLGDKLSYSRYILLGSTALLRVRWQRRRGIGKKRNASAPVSLKGRAPSN